MNFFIKNLCYNKKMNTNVTKPQKKRVMNLIITRNEIFHWY